MKGKFICCAIIGTKIYFERVKEKEEKEKERERASYFYGGLGATGGKSLQAERRLGLEMRS
jgi:hypothetical protein